MFPSAVGVGVEQPILGGDWTETWKPIGKSSELSDLVTDSVARSAFVERDKDDLGEKQ